MTRPAQSSITLAALSILDFAIFSDALFAQQKVDHARAAQADIPSGNAADLRAFEKQLKSVASKVTTAVIAVGPGASRVIVSADGLVLTQGHCAPEPTVRRERHSHGIETLEAFREANAAVRESVVQVRVGNETAALVAVVDADGLVLTKASEVPDGVRCRLADGRVLAALVVGIDQACDLALLRLPTIFASLQPDASCRWKPPRISDRPRGSRTCHQTTRCTRNAWVCVMPV